MRCYPQGHNAVASSSKQNSARMRCVRNATDRLGIGSVRERDKGRCLSARQRLTNYRKTGKQKTKPRDTNHNSDAVGVEDTIKVQFNLWATTTAGTRHRRSPHHTSLLS